MRKIILPVNDIIADYQSGLSSLKIAEKYRTSKRVILSRLQEHDIPRRSLSDACRKNSLDTKFFDVIDSERKAYWLGFLLADGNIQPCGRFNKGRMIRIALQVGDYEHLEKYLADIKSSHSLVYTTTTHSPSSLVEGEIKAVWAKFTSIPMATSLENKGWHEFKRKGDTKILENVPKDHHVHLLRGLLDGDGYISKKQDRSPQSSWILGFCDLHKSVVLWVQEQMHLVGITGNVTPRQSKNNRVWHVTYGNKSVPFALNELYGQASVFLNRKKKLATEAWQQVAVQK